MIPSRRAEELCMRFLMYPHTNEEHFGMNKEMAKQCALIAVDEIITVISHFSYTFNAYDDFETKKIEAVENIPPWEYWEQVKLEINKI